MAEAEVEGLQRAAILLMTLGEENAAAILRHMNVEEVQQLGGAMAELDNVSRDRVSDVLGDFLSTAHHKTSIGFGTADYLRKVLTNSLGERKANGLLGQIIRNRESSGLEALRWMDPETVARVISAEHPQIVATVLAHLSAQQAAAVLKRLPEELHSQVALRIARLKEVPESALAELDRIVDAQTQDTTALKSQRMGGVRTAADIIGLMGTDSEQAILEAIKEIDSDLSQQIQDSLLVFENLMGLDDRGMQRLLRDVQSDQLGLALKGADGSLQEKIFKNMSKRAAEILRDDMQAKGPVRLSEVEAAQKEIMETAQRLAEEGEIMLGGGGDDFV